MVCKVSIRVRGSVRGQGRAKGLVVGQGMGQLIINDEEHENEGLEGDLLGGLPPQVVPEGGHLHKFQVFPPPNVLEGYLPPQVLVVPQGGLPHKVLGCPPPVVLEGGVPPPVIPVGDLPFQVLGIPPPVVPEGGLAIISSAVF